MTAITDADRRLAALALTEAAAQRERESRGHKWAGPGYADLRRELRNEARKMRALAGRLVPAEREFGHGTDRSSGHDTLVTTARVPGDWSG